MKKLLIILTAYFSIITAGEWQVDKNGENSVVFHSSTTLLDFKGTTENIDGYLYWEGDSLIPVGSEFYFEVKPATFRTGIGKRDSDMREDVLETNKYPVSSFKGKIFETERVKNSFKIKATGIFSLHGKTKEITVNATIKQLKKKLQINSDFSLFLKDYMIEAPSLMAFVKVAQEIKLSLSFDLIKIK